MSKRERDDDDTQLSTAELLEIVQDITSHTGSTKEKQSIYRKKYPTFADRYPTLFEMATAPNFDLQRFTYMLNMRDSVQQQSISQFDASVKVGQNLFDAYIKK
jgi:hypothetical protein